MKKEAYEIRIREWMDILQAANESELSKTEWCRQNGITKRVFYYWQRKVQDYLLETGMVLQSITAPVPTEVSALPEQPVFCEISEPATDPARYPSDQTVTEFRADALISCGAISILINEDTSERTLSKLITALRNVT